MTAEEQNAVWCARNMAPRGRFAAPAAEAPATAAEDLSRALWTALVTALTSFLRAARPLLGMRHGETCPRCGHRY